MPRPFGRATRDFTPTEAERKLADHCRRGVDCVFDHKVPSTATADNTISAAFLRFLALGGDAQTPVHEKGVVMCGAFVAGALDLESARLPGDLWCVGCRLEEDIVLRAAAGRSIGFPASHLKGVTADRLTLVGNFSLQDAEIHGEMCLIGATIGGQLNLVEARLSNEGGAALSCDGAEIGGTIRLEKAQIAGETRLIGATIGGDLDLVEARLSNEGGDALSCDGAEIGGTIRLDNAQIDGATSLAGAKIGGQLILIEARLSNKGGAALSCDRAEIGEAIRLDNAQIDGATRLIGAKIGGQLVCEGATFRNAATDALNGQGARIGDILVFRNVTVSGELSFQQAMVETLVDDATSWPAGAIDLDGFRYARISNAAPLDARTRIAWLNKQISDNLGARFCVQPWNHLARILREQGHEDEAAQVDMAREDALRKAGRAPYWAPLHRFFGFAAGYGYRPRRLLVAAFFVWLFCGVIYAKAARNGLFAPTNALVYQNPDLAACRPQNGGNWTTCATPKAPEEYASFSPWAYSLDVLLPFVTLGQANDWAPLTPGADWNWGYVVRCLVWFEELFGWVAGLTLAGVLANLVRRRD